MLSQSCCSSFTPISYSLDQIPQGFVWSGLAEIWLFGIPVRFDSTQVQSYIEVSAKETGAWHHYALSWNSLTGVLQVYMDGDLWLYCSMEETKGLMMPSGGTLALGQFQGKIGGFLYSSRSFVGFMDEVRVWNKSLSQAEIRQNINWSFLNTKFPKPPGLVSCWSFDESFGLKSRNSSVVFDSMQNNFGHTKLWNFFSNTYIDVTQSNTMYVPSGASVTGEGIPTIISLSASATSTRQVRLLWVDPNDILGNQFLNVIYAIDFYPTVASIESVEEGYTIPFPLSGTLQAKIQVSSQPVLFVPSNLPSTFNYSVNGISSRDSGSIVIQNNIVPYGISSQKSIMARKYSLVQFLCDDNEPNSVYVQSYDRNLCQIFQVEDGPDDTILLLEQLTPPSWVKHTSNIISIFCDTPNMPSYPVPSQFSTTIFFFCADAFTNGSIASTELEVISQGTSPISGIHLWSLYFDGRGSCVHGTAENFTRSVKSIDMWISYGSVPSSYGNFIPKASNDKNFSTLLYLTYSAMPGPPTTSPGLFPHTLCIVITNTMQLGIVVDGVLKTSGSYVPLNWARTLR
eukprot:TRINITY_DN6497_c0_g3_i1.p1 TRINITY_DN6497_c0_g3~~TRINITY_DN6497_c0_g3_i1.p1  ORF type:complete len:570 (+),score=90.54 TRINITY_DN6497_c0_g3_i1:272-1981(+)